MASPAAMAKCLRADATLMAVADEAVLARAQGLAEKLVVTTNEVVASVNLTPAFTTVILMLAAAIALEGEDAGN